MNASTNTPTLSNGGGGGAKGDVFTVTTAGTTTIDAWAWPFVETVIA